MEIYVQLIFIMALAKYCLKAALTGRLWVMAIYAAFASLIGIAIYPFVITQPVTIISNLLANQKMVTDGSVITTIEAVAGIFTSVFLLDNYFMPKAKRKKSIFVLKVFPGILSLCAIAYFELLFFKFRVGSDFTATAILYSAIVFSVIAAVSILMKYLIKGESMKLELKLLLNMGILFVGLLVQATVADYNLSNAETVVEWKAMIALIIIAILFFFVGILLPKINFKRLFKTK